MNKGHLLGVMLMRRAVFYLFMPQVLFILSSKAYTCELKVGWEDWPPYQFKKGEQVTGLDMDIVKAIAKAEGCTVSFDEIPWKRHLVNIERGKTDLATGASKTPDREKYANFTDNYRNETMSLFVSKDKKDLKIKNTKELIELIKKDQFKLGVLRGYYYGEEFKKSLEDQVFKSKVEEVTSIKQNLIKCSTGRIDGILGDKFVVTHNIIEEGLADKVFLTKLDVNTDAVFIMLSKKSVDKNKLDLIQSGLEKISKNGTLEKIKESYLLKK